MREFFLWPTEPRFDMSVASIAIWAFVLNIGWRGMRR